jgi:hypothetical protein
VPEEENIKPNLLGFLRAVGSHWVSLMSGSFITVALGMYAYFSGQNIPRGIYIPVLVFFVILACYLAWKDSQTELAKYENKEAHKRAFLIERLNQFISEYNQIDDGIIRVSLENSGRGMKRDAYYKRVKGFLEQHWGKEAVEEFGKRKTAFLEELLGKLMDESL